MKAGKMVVIPAVLSPSVLSVIQYHLPSKYSRAIFLITDFTPLERGVFFMHLYFKNLELVEFCIIMCDYNDSSQLICDNYYYYFYSSDEGKSEDKENGSSKTFRLLLFYLARELISEAYTLQNTPLPPPWIKQSFPQSRMLLVMHSKSQTALFSHIEEQAKVLFAWKPSSEKETLMIRWAKKNRDLVDQVCDIFLT